MISKALGVLRIRANDESLESREWWSGALEDKDSGAAQRVIEGKSSFDKVFKEELGAKLKKEPEPNELESSSEPELWSAWLARQRFSTKAADNVKLLGNAALEAKSNSKELLKTVPLDETDNVGSDKLIKRKDWTLIWQAGGWTTEGPSEPWHP